MKVLGFAALHYGVDYLRASLMSVRDHVDKFHISYSKKPSHGFSTPLVNPDPEWKLKQIAQEVLGEKLIWESNEQFTSEIEHRQQRYKYAQGYSLILTVDADEIFDTTLPNVLIRAYNANYRFYGIDGYHHYYKSSYYFQDSDCPVRIENLTQDNSNMGTVFLGVQHMSLCQRPEIIRYKTSCFGHRDEIKPYWLERFENWTPETDDINTSKHPTRSDIWFKPIFDSNPLPPRESFNQEKNMRILLIPTDYHRHTEDPKLFTNMLDAFNRQAVAQIFTTMDLAIRFKPDVIFFQGSLSPEHCEVLKKETGALFTMWTGDARYMPTTSLMDYKEVVDLYLLPFREPELNTYRTILGKKCEFLWEFIQDWRYMEPKMLKEGSVSFVGNVYENMPGGQIRTDLEDFLHRNLINEHVVFRGSGFTGGQIPYEQVPDFYNQSYAVICENNFSDIHSYFTPRNLGAMAAGSCALMKYFPGIEVFFQNLIHCVYYRDKYELLECIDFLNKNSNIRNTIASNGHKLAIENFSMDKWVETFLKTIKNV